MSVSALAMDTIVTHMVQHTNATESKTINLICRMTHKARILRQQQKLHNVYMVLKWPSDQYGCLKHGQKTDVNVGLSQNSSAYF